MYKAIKLFFEHSQMHKGSNCTNITLLPNVMHASSMTQYRPISCASVLYKIIARVLAKRLQGVIGSIIDIVQSGFIPGGTLLIMSY